MKLKLIGLMVIVFALGSATGVQAVNNMEKIEAYLDHGIRLVLYGEEFIPKDVDGKEVIPINYQGSTYLPIRGVAEAIGLPVKWDPDTLTASVGFEYLQLNNYTTTSFVDIQVDGNWRPSYITPIRKQYSNSFMGVVFEINPTNSHSIEELVERESKRIGESNAIVLDTYTQELDRYTAQVIEYRTYYSGGEAESHSHVALIPSDNSDEYYMIHVYVTDEKYEENKDVFNEILSTFRKQK